MEQRRQVEDAHLRGGRRTAADRQMQPQSGRLEDHRLERFLIIARRVQSLLNVAQSERPIAVGDTGERLVGAGTNVRHSGGQ